MVSVKRESVKAASNAYDKKPKHLSPSYKYLSQINTPLGIHAKVYQNIFNGDVLIGIRGTSTIAEAKVDVNVGSLPFKNLNGQIVGQVYKGFADAWAQFQPLLSAELNSLSRLGLLGKRLDFGGHSLGGALSDLASVYYGDYYPDLNISSTTIGSPKVGDLQFAKYARKQKNVERTRIYRDKDTIPNSISKLPGFSHFKHIEEKNTLKLDNKATEQNNLISIASIASTLVHPLAGTLINQGNSTLENHSLTRYEEDLQRHGLTSIEPISNTSRKRGHEEIYSSTKIIDPVIQSNIPEKKNEQLDVAQVLIDYDKSKGQYLDHLSDPPQGSYRGDLLRLNTYNDRLKLEIENPDFVTRPQDRLAAEKFQQTLSDAKIQFIEQNKQYDDMMDLSTNENSNENPRQTWDSISTNLRETYKKERFASYREEENLYNKRKADLIEQASQLKDKSKDSLYRLFDNYGKETESEPSPKQKEKPLWKVLYENYKDNIEPLMAQADKEASDPLKIESLDEKALKDLFKKENENVENNTMSLPEAFAKNIKLGFLGADFDYNKFYDALQSPNGYYVGDEYVGEHLPASLKNYFEKNQVDGYLDRRYVPQNNNEGITANKSVLDKLIEFFSGKKDDGDIPVKKSNLHPIDELLHRKNVSDTEKQQRKQWFDKGASLAKIDVEIFKNLLVGSAAYDAYKKGLKNAESKALNYLEQTIERAKNLNPKLSRAIQGQIRQYEI